MRIVKCIHYVYVWINVYMTHVFVTSTYFFQYVFRIKRSLFFSLPFFCHRSPTASLFNRESTTPETEAESRRSLGSSAGQRSASNLDSYEVLLPRRLIDWIADRTIGWYNNWSVRWLALRILFFYWNDEAGSLDSCEVLLLW